MPDEHLARADRGARRRAGRATLRPGDVVLVSGELGAGKTTFVRGALRALGVTEPVTSPTFTIGHRYEGGRVPVAHLDLYRLGGARRRGPGLLDDYLAARRSRSWSGREAAPSRDAGRRARRCARVRLEHRGRRPRGAIEVASA